MATTAVPNSSPVNAPKKDLEVTFDKSAIKRNASHFFAIWVSIGWMFFFLALPVTVFVLYMYSKILMVVVLGIVVLSAVYPVTRNLQPKWGWALGMWCVKKSAEYFHIKVLVEDSEALRKCGPAIIAMEPHDVLPISIFSFNDALNSLPGHHTVGCVTSACFSVPIMKHMYTWFDVVAVEKQNIITALRNGISPILIPGGVQEVSYLTNTDNECVLFLKSRLGFIKIAMQQGVPIIPVFSFGLRGTYSFWLPSGDWALKVGRTLGFLPMVILGLWGVPFGPAKPCDYVNVVGMPIEVVKTDDPNEEQLKETQEKFFEALRRLFEHHKEEYGMGAVTLRIV